MYAGGQFLEAFAERHARREMTALLARVPRIAVRHRADGLEEVALDLIVPGDRLLVRQGDVIPTDGVVASALAVLDQSALTGEPVPDQHHAGDEVMSGSTNGGEAFDHRLAKRCRKHLCRHRSPGRRGAAFQGADVATGRSIRDGLSRNHRADRCRCLVLHGRARFGAECDLPGRAGFGAKPTFVGGKFAKGQEL
jgi:magnesium-transporting ATPase (P-type)